MKHSRWLRLGLSTLIVLGSTALLSAAPHRASAQDTIFQDDFSDDTNPNQWLTGKTDSTSVTLANGKMTVVVNGGFLQTTYPKAITIPADADATVTGQPVTPNKNGAWSYGLGLRGYKSGSDTRYYLFYISGDGQWNIAVHPKTGTVTSLQSGAIDGFKATDAYTIRGVAQGSHFTMFVNDNQVGETDDSSVDPNDTYFPLLYAQADSTTPKFTVAFTNLSIVAPGDTSAPSATPTKSGKPGKSPTPSVGKKTPTPSKKVTPTATASDNSSALFSDDFSDDTNPNGWVTGKGDTSSAVLLNGKMTVSVLQAGYFRVTYPENATLPADEDATVTAQPINPDKSGGFAYGLGLRGYKNGDVTKYYIFYVTGTGKWAIAAHPNTGEINDLKTGKLAGFKASNPVTIRAVAQGTTLTMYVNDKQVGTVDDSSIDPNDTYFPLLFVQVTDSAQNASVKAVVEFTNLTVVAPS
jgi:hypothetical protein